MAYDYHLEFNAFEVCREILGLKKVGPDESFGVADFAKLHAAVEAGFPISVLERLTQTGLTWVGVAQACAIDPRTARRRRTAGARLDMNESDRVLRLACAISAIAGDEGDVRGAVRWLTTPHSELAGAAPIVLFGTIPGRELVDRLHTEDVQVRAARTIEAKRKKSKLSAVRKRRPLKKNGKG